jgi:hypothetical protein
MRSERVSHVTRSGLSSAVTRGTHCKAKYKQQAAEGTDEHSSISTRHQLGNHYL